MFNGKCIYRSTHLSKKMISVIPLATGQDQLPQCLQGLILGHLNGGNPVAVTTQPGNSWGKTVGNWWLNQGKCGFHGIHGI